MNPRLLALLHHFGGFNGTPGLPPAPSSFSGGPYVPPPTLPPAPVGHIGQPSVGGFVGGGQVGGYLPHAPQPRGHDPRPPAQRPPVQRGGHPMAPMPAANPVLSLLHGLMTGRRM